MSDIFDEVAAANETFAQEFMEGDLPAPPRKHLAVLTCMDARILPLTVFGLENGDAHIIRNAGGRVTEDALRSLLVSTHVLEVRNIAVVHHTECGMAKATDEQIRDLVETSTGRSTAGIAFHAIGPDADAAIRGDVARLVESGLFPEDTRIKGYQYDVRTGRLRQVV